MSYEGYVQNICEDGHYFNSQESYVFLESDEEDNKCPCGKKSVWQNHVDQTNGDDFGYIPVELLNKKAHNLYMVPSRTESIEMRTYLKDDCELYLITTDTLVIIPTYESECLVDNTSCVGLGSFYTKEPSNNMCLY